MYTIPPSPDGNVTADSTRGEWLYGSGISFYLLFTYAFTVCKHFDVRVICFGLAM